MADPATIDPNVQTSHEQDGRVLSGMGVSAEQLAETMERHAPEPTAEPPVVAEPAAEPVTPTPSKGRQRYSDLTRERDEAKAAAATATAEREALARERDELKAKITTPPAAAPVTEPAKPAAEPTYTRPMPTEDEIGTKYENYPAFMRDIAKWVLEQERAGDSTEARVRAVLAEERQRESFIATVQAAQERGRKAYADFDTLLEGPAGNIPLGRDRQESLARVAFIAKHPQSEHIQYAILKDATLANRLQQSDGPEFGLLIAGLAPQAVSRAASSWTPPPSPHPTVGASSPTTPTPSRDLAKGGFDFDKSGYREKRAAERGLKRR